jgi:hypothetical protein
MATSNSTARSVPPPAGTSSTAAIHEPQTGDLVVVRQDPPPAFGVLQHPSGVQFGASTRDAAVSLARSFAEAHKVDLWFREQDVYRLLERYRPLGRVRS